MKPRPTAPLQAAAGLTTSAGSSAIPTAVLNAAGSSTPSGRVETSATRYRTVQVDGLDIFYREAGPKDAPVLLLLHGFPASSFMYRDLMTQLADRYRVIAPDYPGFGYSAAPSAKEYSYTFDRLADVIEKFTAQLALHRYAIYMQDFGGPVGFRLATRHPDNVTALIVQNANAYEEGLPEKFWALPKSVWRDPSPEKLRVFREEVVSDAALEWNYTHGVRDQTFINPDNWVLQQALVNRPGNKDIMLALLYDYRTNPEQYPAWQAYFREHQPPTLIVWGKHDEIFPAPGAQAYLKDLPDAELHLLDTGHFALEDKSREIAQYMRQFLSKLVQQPSRGAAS